MQFQDALLIFWFRFAHSYHEQKTVPVKVYLKE